MWITFLSLVILTVDYWFVTGNILNNSVSTLNWIIYYNTCITRILDDCNTMIVIIVPYNEVFVLNIALYLMLKMLHNGIAVSIVCLLFYVHQFD